MNPISLWSQLKHPRVNEYSLHLAIDAVKTHCPLWQKGGKVPQAVFGSLLNHLPQAAIHLFRWQKYTLFVRPLCRRIDAGLFEMADGFRQIIHF